MERRCRCGKAFQARQADVKRGWAKFCSKSCKAKEQTRRTGVYGPIKENTMEDKRDGTFQFIGPPTVDQ